MLLTYYTDLFTTSSERYSKLKSGKTCFPT